MRSSYVKVNIEGRKTILQGGPKTRDGYMVATFWSKHRDSSILEVIITQPSDDCTDLVVIHNSGTVMYKRFMRGGSGT